MGLLGILLTFPVSGPVLAAKAAIGTVLHEAERQLYDEEAIRGALTEAERAFKAGEIGAEDYEEREEMLLQRLIEARRWHMEQAEKEGGDR